MFEIVENAPLPRKAVADEQLALPLAAMQVGHSFFVPAEMKDRFQNIRVRVSAYNTTHGTFIRCTTTGDGQLHVWRDEDTNTSSVGGRQRKAKTVTLKTIKHDWQQWLIALEIGVNVDVPTDVLDKQGVSTQVLKQWAVDLWAQTRCEWSVLEMTKGTVSVMKSRSANA